MESKCTLYFEVQFYNIGKAEGKQNGITMELVASEQILVSPPWLSLLKEPACRCKFEHPLDQPATQYNSLGLPLRPGMHFPVKK